MNLLFSSLKTLRVERLEFLEEGAILFSNDNPMDEEKKEEDEELCTKGSRSLEILGLAEFEEAENMANVEV